MVRSWHILLASLGLVLLFGSSFAQEKTPISPTTVEKLLKQLGDDSFQVREQASNQLVNLGPAIMTLVLREAKQSDDLEVRERCQQILLKLEHHLPVLLERLKSPDPAVRLATIEKLTPHGSKAIPLLEKLLADASSAVRDGAYAKLLELDPENKHLGDKALKQASVNGKYAKLLRKIHVPTDEASYTKFRDYGEYPACAEYLGHKNLPAGYWVYVAPHWYIWGEQK